MILADTSVWMDHFRQGKPTLADLLNANKIAIHPFVIGELALGSLAARKSTLLTLNDLPRVESAMDYEVLRFIETHALFGIGICYIDAHLLTSVRLTPGTALWTRDKRLQAAAERLGWHSPLSIAITGSPKPPQEPSCPKTRASPITP